MLSFTYAGKESDGSFNGRFVFRATSNSLPVPLSTLIDLFEGAEESFSDTLILHEFLHFLCFRESLFGIETVGRRFHARATFVQGNTSAAIDYYRQRTVYFITAYHPHEGAVRRLECRHKKGTDTDPRRIRLDRRLRQLLRRVDSRARALNSRLGCNRSRWHRWLDLTLGYIATREFGLQAYVIGSEGKAGLREVSLSSNTAGIINAAFETELSKPNAVLAWIKRLRQSLNTERRASGSEMSSNLMARWAALKFHTEFRTIHRLFRLCDDLSATHIPAWLYKTIRHASRLRSLDGWRSVDSREWIQAYSHQIAAFTLRHTLLPADPLSVGTLRATILACDTDQELADVLQQLADNFQRVDKKILYHFYVHGN